MKRVREWSFKEYLHLLIIFCLLLQLYGVGRAYQEYKEYSSSDLGVCVSHCGRVGYGRAYPVSVDPCVCRWRGLAKPVFVVDVSSTNVSS